MAYAVGQRSQEIGVRIALGAQSKNILWMISGQGLVIIGIGLGLGLLVAASVGQLVGNFLAAWAHATSLLVGPCASIL
jgi:putative ABC transport system permease protein